MNIIVIKQDNALERKSSLSCQECEPKLYNVTLKHRVYNDSLTT